MIDYPKTVFIAASDRLPYILPIEDASLIERFILSTCSQPDTIHKMPSYKKQILEPESLPQYFLLNFRI